MTSKFKSLVVSPHLWIAVLLFTLNTISHYHELLVDVPVLGQISSADTLGLQRDTLDRLIYVVIIAYSGWFLGARLGTAVLVASVLAMSPHIALVSPRAADGVLGMVCAVLAGALLLLTFRAWSSIARERDKQREVMEQLRLSEESYRELFRNASDAIWVHDLKGNIIDANRTTENMTGYTLDELGRTNVKEFLDAEGRELARDIKSKLLKGEPVEPRYEQRLVNRRDGRESIVELTTRLIPHDGEPVAFHNIARDVTEERRMREGMRYFIQRVLVAQEEERKRIARELHDDAAQSVLLLMKRLDEVASSKEWDKMPEPLRERLSQANDSAMEALNGLRRYAQELRPAILDDMGLVAALEWLADSLSQEGVDVITRVSDLGPDLPHEAELVLFRIAQEALNNVRKHAEASKVVLTLERGEGRIRMVINDNGRGFELPARMGDLSSSGRLGIIGMQERARLLGGTLSVESEMPGGTTVTADISWWSS